MTDQPVVPEEPTRTGLSFCAKAGMFIIIIALLTTLGAAAYLNSEFSKLKNHVTQLSGGLQKTAVNDQQDVTGLQKTVSEMQATMQQYSTQQQQLTTEWRGMQSTDMSKWHVLYAEYLIKMANDQLQFFHNTNTALQLLQQADKELQTSTDPAMLDIRKSLATDITNLQAASTVDVTAMFLRLHALNELVDKLPLPIQPLQSEQRGDAKPNEASVWKEGVQSVWHGLNKIVIIRKNEANALPLVMPEEKQFIYQNLHAELHHASWGLLHDNEVVYSESLKLATSWVQQYFVQSAPETQTFLQQLSELQKISIKPAVVKLTTTSQLFDGYHKQ